MNEMRRRICQILSGLIGFGWISACGQPAPIGKQRVYTETELRLIQKYRGVSGYNLWVALLPRPEPSPRGLYCKVVDEKANYVAGGIGIQTSTGGNPPVFIDATLFDNTDANFKDKQPVVVGQWTVPIADRIPDDLLDDLRRDPKGSLRIKIRLHREGVLLGWDIERRPGFDPKKRDQWGEAVYVAPVHSFVGGDFQEAKIFNGKAVRKGWYIHPRTKERIETDF